MLEVWLISSFTSEKSFEFFFLIFEQYNQAFYQSICVYNWFLQNIQFLYCLKCLKCISLKCISKTLSNCRNLAFTLLNIFKIFLPPFLDFNSNVYVYSFFRCTARLWDSLLIEWFPLTYNLNRFKSRINRHLLTVGSFYKDFLYDLTLLWFFFFVTACLVVAVQSCMGWISIKKS